MMAPTVSKEEKARRRGLAIQKLAALFGKDPSEIDMPSDSSEEEEEAVAGAGVAEAEAEAEAKAKAEASAGGLKEGPTAVRSSARENQSVGGGGTK